MTIEQLIKELQKIEDKSKDVLVRNMHNDMNLAVEIDVYIDSIEIHSRNE